ncbi:hypothetical protein [Chitinophaga lutea]|uniref:hypothetical protein n=1 Tax=Chitinophaga lutea TaxID=2488634 RepID=UPI000F507418|nr:hypothetical protein [Chitinophaga lutea]
MKNVITLSKEQMKDILGGEVTNPGGEGDAPSICSVWCKNKNTYGTKDCGLGVSCYADPERESVYCGDTEYCPCD